MADVKIQMYCSSSFPITLSTHNFYSWFIPCDIKPSLTYQLVVTQLIAITDPYPNLSIQPSSSLKQTTSPNEELQIAKRCPFIRASTIV